ncbi:hypothetical protein KP509_05G082700 [Ceratopteris richardii]|uniref:Uncharacterized protein n=1 Tax=Ceratopteris richardii TaxID=49495 RepID=A0A8T2UW13_CERRI|nr:hypothetical protein KP509_05G082600 [Ceratopteris richardii]KAH7437645.1 hypothetical protein KP509_05G082700 [Ceratopteris richardii]KAH7437646.1 hypothetical protein KP509_05G082700 [Ceratopteris richardii]
MAAATKQQRFLLALIAYLASAASCVLCSSRQNSLCPLEESAVYPYAATCAAPAMYSSFLGGQSYYIVPYGGNGGGLAPEWDESASTFRVIFSEDNPAAYELGYADIKLLPFVMLADDQITFANSATKRVIALQGDLGFGFTLVETDDSAKAAKFQFVLDTSVGLPCPRIYGAQCKAYTIASSDYRGLSVSKVEVDGEPTTFTLSYTDKTVFVVYST